VVGQLHGNQNNICASLDSNNCFCTQPRVGEYGRFDLSWDGGGTAQTRLRDWLDPTNSNIASLNTLIFPEVSGSPHLCNNSQETYGLPNIPPGISVSWSKSSSKLTFQSGQNSPVVTVSGASFGNGPEWIRPTLSGSCGTIQLDPYPIWLGVPKVMPDYNGNNNAISMVPNTSEGASPLPCIHWASDVPKVYYWELNPAERYRVEGETSWDWSHGHSNASANYWESSNHTGLYMNLTNYQQYSNGWSYLAAQNSCGSTSITGMGWAICSTYYSYSVFPNPMNTSTLNIAFQQENNELLTNEVKTLSSASLESSGKILVKGRRNHVGKLS